MLVPTSVDVWYLNCELFEDTESVVMPVHCV